MKLTDLVSRELVNLHLQGSTRDEILREMADVLAANGRLLDKDAYLDAVFAREQEGSTGIGFGIAIPHGKSAAVKTPSVAFGKKPEGVDWNSLDGEPAHLVFLLAVPETAEGNEHLKILQMLSRKLIDDEFRQGLLQAANVDEVMALLETVE
ncbi:hypothetical protein GCM10025857_10100 [Alicyclobacillus contaminans]|nr:hypothetical protein GCM10025857_10100 [Alicyclobacillus contaminans]